MVFLVTVTPQGKIGRNGTVNVRSLVKVSKLVYVSLYSMLTLDPLVADRIPLEGVQTLYCSTIEECELCL